MPENNINLLPEELRGKEIKPTQKDPAEHISYTAPPKAEKPVAPQMPKEPFWKKFSFGRKNKDRKIKKAEIIKEEKIEAETNVPKPIKVDLQSQLISPPIPEKPKKIEEEKYAPERKAVEEELAKKQKPTVDLKPKVKAVEPEIPDKPRPKGPPKMSDQTQQMERTVISEVNLIPQSLHWEKKYPAQEKIFYFALTILIGLIISSLFFIGITYYEIKIDRQVKDAQARIEGLDSQIKVYEEDLEKMRDVQDQLTLVDSLLGQHLYWSKIFESLEKYTIEDVYYKDFAATNNGSLNLSAVGRNYTSVARQLVSFEQAADFVKDTKITSANLEITEIEGIGSTSKVNFSIILSIKEEVFFEE